MHTTHKELCSTTHKEQLHTKAKGALSPEAQAKDLTEHILEGELCQASQRLTLHLSGRQGKVALDAKGPLLSWIKMTDAAVPGKAKDRQAQRPGSPTALAGFFAGYMVPRCQYASSQVTPCCHRHICLQLCISHAKMILKQRQITDFTRMF